MKQCEIYFKLRAADYFEYGDGAMGSDGIIANIQERWPIHRGFEIHEMFNGGFDVTVPAVDYNETGRLIKSHGATLRFALVTLYEKLNDLHPLIA